MNIVAYLKKHQLSQEKFGELFDVTQGAVWQWISGETRITAERAVQIEGITKGEITRHELRPDLFRKEKAA